MGTNRSRQRTIDTSEMPNLSYYKVRYLIQSGSPVQQEITSYDPWYPFNGGDPDYEPINLPKHVTEVTNDVVTPMFKRRLAAGEIINNDFSSVKESSVFNSYSATFFRQFEGGAAGDEGDQTYHITYGGFYSLMDTILPWPADFNADVERIRSLATTDLYSKLAEAEALINVTLIEARKTVDMFHRTGMALARLLTKHKQEVLRLKATIRNPVKLAALLRDLWLTYRYGVRPLVADLAAISEALDKIGKGKRTRIGTKRYKGVYQATGTYSESIGNQTFLHLDYDARYTIEYNVRAGALLRPHFRSLKAYESFGSDRILSTIWELVPYSFVVDWFLNTSKWVASFEPVPRCEVLAAWVTTLTEESEVFALADYYSTYSAPGLKSQEFDVDGGGGFRSRSTRLRQADPNKPVLPVTNVRLNLSKIIDLVALAGQLVIR